MTSSRAWGPDSIILDLNWIISQWPVTRLTKSSSSHRRQDYMKINFKMPRELCWIHYQLKLISLTFAPEAYKSSPQNMIWGNLQTSRFYSKLDKNSSGSNILIRNPKVIYLKALLHTDFFNQNKKSERTWLPSIKKSETVTREIFSSW